MKLVRDRLPEIALANGKPMKYRIASANERHELLRDKLFEEACEFFESEEPIELADILEVISALAEEKGKTLEDIIRLADAKRQERGGFSIGVVWHE